MRFGLIVGVALLAVGVLLLAGGGLQLAPPTADSVSIAGRTAFTGQPINDNSWPNYETFVPDRDANVSGVSFRLYTTIRDTSVGWWFDWQVQCGSRRVAAGQDWFNAYVGDSSAYVWVTFRPDTVYSAVVKGETCRIDASPQGSGLQSVYWQRDSLAPGGQTWFAYAVWGIPPSIPPPTPTDGDGGGPGTGSSTGTTSTSSSPPPPKPPAPDLGGIVLLGLLIIALVVGAALVISGGLDLLG